MSTVRTGRLAGKVAIVTGGASGIGEATCKRFAEEGAAIMVADLAADAAAKLAAEIAASGGQADSHQLDVSSEAAVIELMKHVNERFGRLDVVVNSAGIAHRKPEVETTEEEWDRVMNVNVKGTFLMTKHAVPEMKKAGGGAIVNIASIAANVGWAGWAAYCASKGAVRSLTMASATAHAGEGIRVNSINPGTVHTPINAEAFREGAERFKRTTPLGRFGQPIDIANCCLFLACDESAFIVGEEIRADGGLFS
ncbi:MAG: SDR family oxidoreductase [Mesorhizobium sp.]